MKILGIESEDLLHFGVIRATTFFTSEGVTTGILEKKITQGYGRGYDTGKVIAVEKKLEKAFAIAIVEIIRNSLTMSEAMLLESSVLVAITG